MKSLISKFFAIAIIFCTCFFAGCKLSVSSVVAPSIIYFDESDTIAWATVSNATRYNIYCDGEVIDTVVDEYDDDFLIYDLSKKINDTINHVIYITGSADSSFIGDSNTSNEILHKNNTTVKIKSFDEFHYNISKDINFTLNGTLLSYNPIEGVDEYYLYIMSNSMGIKEIKLESTSISLRSSSLALHEKDEIFLLRIGCKKDDKNYLLTNEIYYNPDNYKGYTDNIVLFDGWIYDHYIESLQELNQVVYHNFIYRNEDYNIKFSKEMHDLLLKGFGGITLADKTDNAIFYALSHILETSQNYPDNATGGFAVALNGEYEFNIKIDYGKGECNTNISPNVLKMQSEGVGYYDTCDYVMRKEKFGATGGEFYSDMQLAQTYVNTSEELYWAVENKITPRFSNNTNSAYIIYYKVKSILNNIISDDMSDYEKALSIFDYICLNTVYDSSTYADNINVTSLPCYYLEGVFTKGYAVCDGYSKAYSLMCNMLGIECIRVTGEAITGGETGGHAWNKIMLEVDDNLSNGLECFLIDITWTEIQVNNGTEELSRMYFMLSDENVKASHFPYTYRNEFALYSSPNDYNYYANTTYSYKNTTCDLVITSDQEFDSYFYYLLDNSIDYTEFMVDYDYMVNIYEIAKGKKYDSRTDYVVEKDSYGTITGITYYKELVDALNVKMKERKFPVQFMTYVKGNSLMSYMDGKSGLVIVMQQYLLIDTITTNNNEVKTLINYLDENDIYKSFNLIIKDSYLLSTGGITYEDMASRLFENNMDNNNVIITFKVVEKSILYDQNVRGSVYIITISEKV